MILAALAVEIVLRTCDRVSLMAPLQQSLNFFSRYGVTLTFLFAIAGVAAEIVSLNLAGSFKLEPEWAATVASFIGTGVFEPIASGAAIYFIASRDKGEHLSVYDSVMKSFSIYTEMFICYLTTTLLVLFGLSFYIIPGVFFLYKLIFAEYFIVLNEDDPLAAIQHSFERTQGKAAALFPAFMIILVSLLGCNLLVDSMVTSLGGSNGFRIFGALLEAPLLAFAMVVGYRLFSLTSDSDPTSKAGI